MPPSTSYSAYPVKPQTSTSHGGPKVTGAGGAERKLPPGEDAEADDRSQITCIQPELRARGLGWAQNAKDHLEKALKEAQREGCSVTESELAEHHYKLGRILWTMGGALRDDPTKARAHFEAASKEDCDSQVRFLRPSRQPAGSCA